jgi:hypothetical protein
VPEPGAGSQNSSEADGGAATGDQYADPSAHDPMDAPQIIARVVKEIAGLERPDGRVSQRLLLKIGWLLA